MYLGLTSPTFIAYEFLNGVCCGYRYFNFKVKTYQFKTLKTQVWPFGYIGKSRNNIPCYSVWGGISYTKRNLLFRAMINSFKIIKCKPKNTTNLYNSIHMHFIISFLPSSSLILSFILIPFLDMVLDTPYYIIFLLHILRLT